jgi:DNA-damage-inducible protein J
MEVKRDTKTGAFMEVKRDTKTGAFMEVKGRDAKPTKTGAFMHVGKSRGAASGKNFAASPLSHKPVVRARIAEDVKEEATAVLAGIGLTVSDAFRLMMMRIAKEKALPFDPLIPNVETIEAMKAARRGDVVKAGSVDDLFASLNAGD